MYDPLKTNKRLADALSSLQNPQTDTGNPTLGWANEVSEGSSATDFLKRGDVIADMRTFYKERDGFDGSDDQIVDKFYTDRTWRNVNTVSMAKDVKDVYGMSPEQTARLARIQKLYDALPNFYEEGGRGAAGLAQNIGAGLLDPANLIGFGAGSTAGKVALRAGAREAITQGIRMTGNSAATRAARGQIVRAGVLAGAKAGAKYEAASNAIVGAGQDILTQNRNEDIGLQDGFSTMSLLGNTAAAAAMGGAFGGVFGAAGTAFGGKISRASNKVNKNLFGDFTSKYAKPSEQPTPTGVADEVETQTGGAPSPDKQNVKVTGYVSAQREQYQRNLDAIVDQVRTESGDRGLADWRAGKLKDDGKTEAMKLADDMQEGRSALEELYNWPTKKASLERQLSALTAIEVPKPEHVDRLNELSDRIARGDDAFDSIQRAAGDGQEQVFDETVQAYAKFLRDPKAAIMDPETGQSFPAQASPEAAPVIPDNVEPFTQAFADDVAVKAADETSVSDELNKIDVARASGQQVESPYEQSLKEQYKALAGQDWSPKTTTDTTGAPPAAPAGVPVLKEDATSDEIESAIGTLDKSYNAINNKIGRLRKTMDAGKAQPDAQQRIDKLIAEREALNTHSKQLKERLNTTQAQANAAPNAAQPTDVSVDDVIETIDQPDVVALGAPLDVDGVSSFLGDYGLPSNLVRKELANLLKQKKPTTVAAREATVRGYVADKIRYVRSASHLEGMMESYGTDVAYVPSAMRSLIATHPSIPEPMRQLTAARYDEWLDFNASNLLAQYFAKNPTLEISDLLNLIRDNHGDDMGEVVERVLRDSDEGDVVQHMSTKRGQPQGWDKLTTDQKASIEKSIAAARVKWDAMLGSKMVSPKKIEGMIEIQRQNMVLETLRAEFEKTFGPQSIPSVTGRLASPVFVDPDTKTPINGKIWNRPVPDPRTGEAPAQPVIDTRDKFGVQAMLRKAMGGRATNVDEFGDLVIEHPYFGSLFMKDVVRNADGSIGYVPGTTFRRKYSAAESAARANEQASIIRADNRPTKGGMTNKQKRALEVEAMRADPARKDKLARASSAPIDQAAEDANKAIRESVRAAVVGDAVRDARSTSSPQAALKANIADAEAELGEQVSLQEVERQWSAAEAQDREVSIEQLRQDKINDALAAFRAHNDGDALLADLKKIDEMFNAKTSKPRTHADKPAGAVNQPRVYVARGYEVDVNNHFTFDKTSDKTQNISFLGEKVGDVTIAKDGSANLHYSAPFETTVRFSDLETMRDHLPSVYRDIVAEAGAAGRLQAANDPSSTASYPIDWTKSKTWGTAKRTVPNATPVERPLKLNGPVTQFKENPDVSSANLDIPDGHVMAVHILEGDFKGVTRVESTKAATPQTVSQILGNQKSKAYTVGYVPEGTKSSSRDATRLFSPLDANDNVYRAGAADAGSARGKSANADVTENGQLKLDGLSKIAVDQNDLPIQFRDANIKTLAQLHNAILDMENVRWAEIADEQQYSSFTQDLSDLYEVRAKYAPKGIALPKASRIQSMNQWNRVMSSYDGTSIATGIDILRRLSFMDRDLPIIEGADEAFMGAGNAGGYMLPRAGSDAANRIYLNPKALDPSGEGNDIPAPIALIHEVAHWAYLNVLEDVDRLQFWKSMSKYFDGGRVDMEAVRERLPGLQKDAEAMSPAEFFANQFSQWAVTQGKMNNIPLWTKMARKIVQIAQAFGVRLTGSSAHVNESLVDIDPDLADLFTKILPDNDPMYKRYFELRNMMEDIRQLKDSSHTRAASMASKILVDLDEMRQKLDSAIDVENPADLEMALNEVSEYIRWVDGPVDAKSRPYSGAGTGHDRLSFFNGYRGKRRFATANARASLLHAFRSWREFQRNLSPGSAVAVDDIAPVLTKSERTRAALVDANYRVTESASTTQLNEASTADLDSNASGDLGSGFDENARRAFAMKDDNLTAAMSLHANNFLNAIAVAQDEARSAIARVGELEGKKIRVAKDGSITTLAEKPLTKMYRRRAQRRAQQEEQLLIDTYIKIANDVPTASDRDPLPDRAPIEAIGSVPVQSMSTAQMTAEYKSLAGQRNARKKELEKEIVARVATMPEAEIRMPEDDLADAPIRALERDLFQSIRRGNTTEMQRVANALAYKKRFNLSNGLLPAKNVVVRRAVKVINEHAALGSSDNGVPANAPAQVADTISKVTNRNRNDEWTARTVAHRLTSMLLEGPDGFITRGHIAKIMGNGDIGDTTPVSEADPIFNQFRKQMREISTDMRTPAGKRTGLPKIMLLAANTLTDPAELARIGITAEELANAGGAVFRGGDVDELFIKLPAVSRQRIAEMIQDNMEATALIGRGLMDGVKGDFQAMSYFGDLLAEVGEKSVYRSAAKSAGFRGMHPALTANFKNEYVANLRPARRTVMEDFTGGDLNDNLLYAYDPAGTSASLVEAVGQVQPLVTKGDLGTGVYLNKRVDDLSDDAIRNIAPPAMADDLVWANSKVKEANNRMARELANLEGLRSRGEDVSDFRHGVVHPMSKRLENALGTEAALWRQARASGVVDQPKAVPFVARTLNSFDFTPETEYTFGTQDASSLDWLLSKMENDGSIESSQAELLRQSVTTFDGNQAHTKLVSAIADSMGTDVGSAMDTLIANLKEMGYDSLDTGRAKLVFDPKNVRHLDDASFSVDEIVSNTIGGEPRPLAGQLLETMMEGAVNRDDTRNLVNVMQAFKAPAAMVDPIKKVFKQKPLSANEAVKISWWTRLLGENSSRFRMSGAQWFADKLKPLGGGGFYEKLDALISKSLMVSKDEQGRPMNLLSKIRTLPGYGNTAYRRWMNRNKFYGSVAQPESHRTIVAALRRGDEGVRQLPSDLRQVARDVQSYFRQEIASAHASGLPLAFRKDYFPQVWNVDSIKENPEAFMTAMERYFNNEMRRGEMPVSSVRDPRLVARDKAEMLLKTLTAEGSDGVMLPDNALRSRLEDHFFERVINLKPEDLPGAENFLVQDLEGIIAKYADQMTRRRLLTQEFGLGNHGISTYLNILQNGRDAIIDALRGTKTFARDRFAADAAMDQRVRETTEIIAPIDGSDQEVAEYVDMAIAMLGKNKKQWQANKEKVRSFLINLQDPQIVARQPEFLKRIDAIVNAMAEFGGQPGMIDGQEVKAMATMVAGLSKKPIDQGWSNSPSMMKFSRSIRTFNNISLLGFTTLASLPDIAMPLVRSGHFKAWQTAWKKYATDPHYREMARNVGVSVESVLHERMSHMYNDTSSRVSNAFFNLTFLNNWTNIQREVSATVGFESFKAEAARCQELASKGMQGSRAYNTAFRYLKRYGMEKYAMPGASRLSDLSQSVGNDDLRFALMRFTNEAIFAPNPNDIPLWAQNPVGTMIFQLKSYPLLMARMSKYCVDEMKQGNMRPMGYLMAGAGVLGSSSLAIRDVVQGRGDTDGDGKVDQPFRDRFASEGPVSGPVMEAYNAMAKSIGLDIEAGGTMDAVMGWFSESLMVAGGFGLFADLLHTSVEQSDNQAYGKLRELGWFFGPTFSNAVDAIGVQQSVIDTALHGEDASNSDQRAAARTVVGRVPILGSIKPFRELATNAIAGEAE